MKAFYPRNDDKLKENDITISNRQTGERFILKKESKNTELRN